MVVVLVVVVVWSLCVHLPEAFSFAVGQADAQ